MSLTNRLKELLSREVEIDGQKVHVSDAVLKILIAKALDGDPKALNMLLDRVEGKPGQSIEIGTKGTSFDFDSTRAIQAVNERLEGLAMEGKDTVDEESTTD